MLSALFCSVYPWGGGGCIDGQGVFTQTKTVLIVYSLDDSGPDRNIFKSISKKGFFA